MSKPFRSCLLAFSAFVAQLVALSAVLGASTGETANSKAPAGAILPSGPIPWNEFADFSARDLVRSAAQSAEEQARADAAWSRLFESLEGYSGKMAESNNYPEGLQALEKKFGVASIEFQSWMERWMRRYRERGLEFWDRFPNDRRRWVWLYNATGGQPVRYWRDPVKGAQAHLRHMKKFDPENPQLSGHLYGDECLAEIDQDAQAAWATRYVVMREQFMASPEVPVIARAALRNVELMNRISDYSFRLFPATTSKAQEILILNELSVDFLDFARTYPDYIGFLPENILLALDRANIPQLNAAFLASMKASGVDSLRDFAESRSLEPVKLEIGKPIKIDLGMTSSGKKVGSDLWRGKVVLLDFWAPWCHSCIAGMPDIKKLHDRYQAQGLEVHGICFMEKNDKPEAVQALMNKMNVPWTQSLRQSLSTDSLARTYGFNSVPHLFLLDRDGKLAAIDVYGEMLEKNITELLKNKPVAASGI